MWQIFLNIAYILAAYSWDVFTGEAFIVYPSEL